LSLRSRQLVFGVPLIFGAQLVVVVIRERREVTYSVTGPHVACGVAVLPGLLRIVLQILFPADHLIVVAGEVTTLMALVYGWV
jgi:hypothetical protein